MASPANLGELRLAKLRRIRELHLEKVRRDAEALRRMDVFSAIGYKPFPKQQEFHEATEYSVLYGGSLGGGKAAPWSLRRSGRVSATPAFGSVLFGAATGN